MIKIQLLLWATLCLLCDYLFVTVVGFTATPLLFVLSSNKILPRNKLQRLSMENGNNVAEDNQENDKKYNQILENFMQQQQGEMFGLSVSNNGDDKNRNSPPSKSDLYSDEELGGLLELHKSLQSQTRKESSPENIINESTITNSLHDLVVQTIQQQQQPLETSTKNQNPPKTTSPTTTFQIRAIASDVDGTLLSSNQELHVTTKNAVDSVLSVNNKIQFFFPATGKTRHGALTSLGPDIGPRLRNGPGVYIQGLYCVDNDKIIFEQKLSTAAIHVVESFIRKEFESTSIVGYNGDVLYYSSSLSFEENNHQDTTTTTTATAPIEVIELHEIYKEPQSLPGGTLSQHNDGFHKLLFLNNNLTTIKELRPHVEDLARQYNATVTQALPNMLELLPQGCSKALGVEKVCNYLGIDPTTELVAIGDAENDVEMLKLAAVGIAVGNASPIAKQAADIVLTETNNEGGAGVAIQKYL